MTYAYRHQGGAAVLVKLTSGNRLTLPKAVIEDFPDSRYFDVAQDGGRIVLTPVRLTGADAVRAKLAELGINEDDIGGAIEWVRKDSEHFAPNILEKIDKTTTSR